MLSSQPSFSSFKVSADKLDSITAFPKFFSQASYTKLASYRRAIFQALEVSFQLCYVQPGAFCLFRLSERSWLVALVLSAGVSSYIYSIWEFLRGY